MENYDFNDEEIMSNYINLLKSISIRIREYPIEFFYNEVNLLFFLILILNL